MNIDYESIKAIVSQIAASKPPEVPFLVFANKEDYESISGMKGIAKHLVCGIGCLKYRETFIMVGEKIPKGHYHPLFRPKVYTNGFLLRDDEEVKACQIKGYTYILP